MRYDGAMRPSYAWVSLLVVCGCFSGGAEETSGASSGAPETSTAVTGTTTGAPSTGGAPTTGGATTGEVESSETGLPGASSESGESSGEPPPPPVMGLRGEYYDTYIDAVIERIDPQLDFDWGDGAPGEGVGADRFSARWTGLLVPESDGPHTLIVESDDGVRLWVNGVLTIDDWNGHFVKRNEAAVELKAGVPVAIRVDYFELNLASSARLLWSSPTLSEEVIPTAQLIAAETASGLPPPKPPFTNPVEAFDCPDPGVLGVEAPDGPHFYKVCTGGPFPIRHSRDLVMWGDTGAVVLPQGKPAWAANGGRNWAPEMHKVGDNYIVYFTTVNGGNVLSIGAAYASDPVGPYTETAGPLVEHPLGVIDATYLYSGGTPYLIYKIDGNSQGKATPIKIRQLAADGLSFAGNEVQIMSNDANSWEGGVVEAQWIVERDGFHYMFYSGNVYDNRYRTGVARSVGPLGPYEKLGAPILANNERWVGPGHGSVVTVHGLDYFVYHAWANAGNGKNDGAKGRQVLVDRIVWENGWPRIHDGTPSRMQQPWPGVP